jgi:hypothetical protein
VGLGEIDPGLPFGFILRRCVVEFNGAKGVFLPWPGFIDLLLEIDFDELVVIPIPEEVIESIDQDPDFPSRLNLFFRFHCFSFFCSPWRVLTLGTLSGVMVRF